MESLKAIELVSTKCYRCGREADLSIEERPGLQAAPRNETEQRMSGYASLTVLPRILVCVALVVCLEFSAHISPCPASAAAPVDTLLLETFPTQAPMTLAWPRLHHGM